MAHLRLILPLLLLAGCTTPTAVQTPTSAYPQLRPVLAMPADGSIFNPSSSRMFFETRLAAHVGDAITIKIEEDLSSSSSQALNDKSSGSNKVNGPAALNTVPGMVKQLFNVDVDSDYNLQDKLDQSRKNSSKITGNMMASVIDVLPNGYLMIGGDKMLLINGKQSLLRLTGVVNPANLQADNSISSKQVINARLDQVNRDMPLDASVVAWMQFLFGVALMVY
ncbi:flagellar basal body L-ring protein FlgH [Vogesella oryzae]|uniref:flagellar basal body L-ring protein FlgH n=1 Tax=Vogesella oryzae TaxID=1735285 RepID=UPI0015841EC7|nr:flagellar basal body L-ring protein FlgH [Vogesella oryzae]